MDPSQVLLQAEVNSIDEEEEQKDDDRSPDYSKNNQNPSAPLIEFQGCSGTPSTPAKYGADKLYPTAPPADDSSDANSTASVHSTSV